MDNNVEGDLWRDNESHESKRKKLHVDEDGSLIFILVLFSWSPVYVHLLCLANFSDQTLECWTF